MRSKRFYKVMNDRDEGYREMSIQSSTQDIVVVWDGIFGGKSVVHMAGSQNLGR